MTKSDPESRVSVDVTHADDDGHLVLMVSSVSANNSHRISLAEARTLSLELVKLAYRAELRSQLNHDTEPDQAASSRFHHGLQT